MNDKLFSHGAPWLNKRFSDDAIAYLTNNMPSLVYEEGQAVIDESQNNHYVFLIASGVTKTYISEQEGQLKTLFYSGRGTIASEVNAFLLNPSFINVTVLEPSLIYMIPGDIFKERLAGNQEVMWEFMEQAAFKSHVMANQIAMLSFDTSYKRVSKAMYWIFTTLGEKDSRQSFTYKIATRELTHQDIAEFTGLSRVSVSNVFRMFYREDTIIKKDRHYICHDIRQL